MELGVGLPLGALVVPMDSVDRSPGGYSQRLVFGLPAEILKQTIKTVLL